MGPLVEKAIDCTSGEMDDGRTEKCKMGDHAVDKEGVADSIHDSLRCAVSRLAQLCGVHDIAASVLTSLTTVASAKLETLSRQLAIIERRKNEGLPQPYSSSILHVLSLHGLTYGILERHVRQTCEGEATRAAHLSQQNEVKPRKKAVEKEEEKGEDEEYLQYLGFADIVNEASSGQDENGNVPKKRRKKGKE